jgi:nucleoside phosphorylase
MGLRQGKGQVPTRSIDLQELALALADLLDEPDLTLHIFGSRKDRTGSLRSDVDLLVELRRRITQEEAMEIWAKEPYLDVFRLDLGVAESIVNESQIRASDNGELTGRVGAVCLMRDGSWLPDADSHRHHRVLAERNPAATMVPLYDLEDAVPAERADLLVVTALAEEYHAVLAACGQKSNGASTSLTLTDQGGSPWALRVVNLHEMGSVGAALKTSEALRRTKASHVALVGICAGIPGRSKLLDVIVPKAILYYESGKVTTAGDEPGDDVRQCDEVAVAHIAAVANAFTDVCILAEGHLMACGEKVVSSREFREELQAKHRKLAGIDMESYGVLRAAGVRGARVTVIKSVCDMADEGKSDQHRKGARDAAARTFVDLVARGVFRSA